ncbi:hypothetical protein HW561_01540 [Rhodobacteraceae bacterium B1Z28]|uniref:Uncharacterized protein n=1 Tax=Ruegeria haliotis TaxID=2747601 RepID=A0ABX2PLY0_9RHOB|nr:hypothetical protein [Ruegeria haliotis]NVO54471.1 hypothetical protein [Ruegeria haliotis]
MKTFITAAILSATIMAAPVMAMGIDTSNLTRTLTFPTPISEPVTQDQVKPGK